MKGIVFTEFLEMVEDVFSPDVADAIIEHANLPSGGVYTAVGTYDHSEMVRLVTALSRETGTEVDDLLEVFGKYLFGRFRALYPDFFTGVDSAFGFLEHVEDYIHVEVRKLYPDAELPTFDTRRLDSERLVMEYSSARPFAHLANGLIHGCLESFGETAEVDFEDLSHGEDTHTRFTLRLVGNG
ncbi:heme NO-binding domain-containing protein [Thioalkalivibrio sp. ALE20]|uniref:heme NO-binding domain-containing protein n=1 Tax=Thioalkalivibrio sp. ALE20 TaxID=545275 RepID=UPI00037CFA8C|nr:heme NO-binding domain-containing protein [Thioalkalivibrio sp. ALE20]